MNKVDPQFIKDLILHELIKEKKDIMIKDDTLLEDLNLDSFAILYITSEIEDKYSISLINNPRQIEEVKSNMKTFGQFIDFLNKKINHATGTK